MVVKFSRNEWLRNQTKKPQHHCDLVSKVMHYHFYNTLWVIHVSSIQCVGLQKAQISQDGPSWRMAPLQGRWLSTEESSVQYKRKMLFYMTTHHFSIQVAYSLSKTVSWNFSIWSIILFSLNKKFSSYPLLPITSL